MLPKEHLSYSQLSSFLRCGEAYRRRYIEGEIIPPGIALIKGSSVHRGIEYNGRQKIETKLDLKKSDIVDYTVNEYEARTTNEEIKIDKGEKKADIIGAGKDSVVSLAGLYADEVSPTIQPVEVEKEIDIDFSGIKIKSIIDCIDENGNVRDFKTAGRSKNQKEVDESLQLAIYSLAYEAAFNKLPLYLILDVLVDTKKPKYQNLFISPPNGVLRQVNYTVQAVHNAIQKGVFLPAAEGSWSCSEKFCGYWETCPFKQNIF